MKKSLIALAAAAALTASFAGSVPAAAQTMPEMSEEEATALARFAMPRAFQGVQQTCRNTLAGDAYMYSSGNRLMGKLQTASRGSWTTARRAIMAMVRTQSPDMLPLINSMPSDSLQPFAEEMIAGMVVSKLNAGECGRIDRVLELLDPLPPENLAALIGYVFVEARVDGALPMPGFGAR